MYMNISHHYVANANSFITIMWRLRYRDIVSCVQIPPGATFSPRCMGMMLISLNTFICGLLALPRPIILRLSRITIHYLTLHLRHLECRS